MKFRVAVPPCLRLWCWCGFRTHIEWDKIELDPILQADLHRQQTSVCAAYLHLSIPWGFKQLKGSVQIYLIVASDYESWLSEIIPWGRGQFPKRWHFQLVGRIERSTRCLAQVSITRLKLPSSLPGHSRSKPSPAQILLCSTLCKPLSHTQHGGSSALLQIITPRTGGGCFCSSVAQECLIKHFPWGPCSGQAAAVS